MEDLQSPFVFLSYAAPDKERVLAIREFLNASGISVWLDDRIHAGQRWEAEIQYALNAAELALVFLSAAALEWEGYFQEEFRMIQEKARYRPDSRAFTIPVLLDAGMPIPEIVRDLRCVQLTAPAGYTELLRAIRGGMGQREREREAIRSEAEIDWKFHSLEEKWDGLPGYEARVSWPVYTSTRYPLISHIGDAIRAEMQMMLAGERGVMLDPQPEIHSVAQEKVFRTNALNVALEDPVIRNRVFTQYATIYGYWAGAAHGHQGPRSWVFVLEPLVPIADLRVVFKDPDAAFAVLQAQARARLFARLEAVDPVEDEDERDFRKDRIHRGTVDWESFGCFGFEDGGLGLRFAPNLVADYSFGTMSVRIPYGVIKELLRRPYFDALGLAYWVDDAAGDADAAEAPAETWPPPSADGEGDWWR